MVLTLPVREVVPATPRSRVVRIGLRGALFSYSPGQAVLVATHDHQARRPYSLASAPEDAEREDCLELLVGLNAHGAPGSDLTLERGALIDVEGPLGRFTFPDAPDTDRFVFIAGGTGIAPVRSMLHRALHVPHRSIGVLYSARTLSDFAYGDELQDLARHGRIELRQTVTREVATEEWSGAVGRLGSAEIEQLVHDPETLCFICGPLALVHEMPKLLGQYGVATNRIRIEEWARVPPRDTPHRP